MVIPLDLSSLLAFGGAGLMTYVVLAPVRAPANDRISFAPPPLASPLAPWTPAAQTDTPPEDASAAQAARLAEATWPHLVDASAAGCDADARLLIVDALADVRSAWAEAILRAACDDEPDARVRAALEAALALRPRSF